MNISKPASLSVNSNLSGPKISFKPNIKGASSGLSGVKFPGLPTPNIIPSQKLSSPAVNSSSSANTTASGNDASTVNTDPVGVRNSLVSMGFDNKNIGYDNNLGTVTYNGKGIVQPSHVSDGSAYAPENINYAGAADWLSNNGYRSVRSGLNKRGIDNSRIGYNQHNGYVTVDGKSMYKPQYNVDGTTWATDSELNDIAREAYANSGDNLVGVRDYVTEKGYASGAVDWDGRNPTVGGRVIPMVYNENGTAYARQSDVDNALDNYIDTAGISTNDGVVDDFQSRYGSAIDSALETVLSRPGFDYEGWNPDDDSVYQRYLDRSRNDADIAMRRELNKKNGLSNGGRIASAMSLKQGIIDDALSRETDYRNMAADRYDAETNRLQNNVSLLRDIAQDYYNKQYTANRDSINDSVTAQQNERNEEWRQREYNDNERVRDAEYDDYILNNALKREQLRVAGDMNDEQLRSSRLANDSAEFDFNIRKASNRGFFTADDEAWYPELAKYRNDDGTYSITPWDAEIKYQEDLQYATSKAQQDAYNGIVR